MTTSPMTDRLVNVAQVATLVAMAFVAFVALFSEPMEASEWLREMAIKAAGLAVAVCAARFYLRWRRSNTILQSYEAWCAKGMEPDGE